MYSFSILDCIPENLLVFEVFILSLLKQKPTGNRSGGIFEIVLAPKITAVNTFQKLAHFRHYGLAPA